MRMFSGFCLLRPISFAAKSYVRYLMLQRFFRMPERRITVWQKIGNGTFYLKKDFHKKNNLFHGKKNFLQQIKKNTREIIENMSEVF